MSNDAKWVPPKDLIRPLTREEVARAYAFARQEAQPGSLLVYLLADLDRLRALVKAAEWEGGADDRECPWCEQTGSERWPSPHFGSCPAFTADGVVR